MRTNLSTPAIADTPSLEASRTIRTRLTRIIPRAWVSQNWQPLLSFVAVTCSALAFRTYMLNWDANGHLHPDERMITFVVQCLGWSHLGSGCWLPDNVADPAHPLNPHFFAYGTFPMYLLALIANGLASFFFHARGLPTDGGTFNDYNHITLIGRYLSALFDTGTVVILGIMAWRFIGRWWGVCAAAFASLTVLSVQLSHFYAFDTVLTFFITLALFGAMMLAQPHLVETAEGQLPPVAQTVLWSLLIGSAFGLALTSKISALPLIVPIGLALLLRWHAIGRGGHLDAIISAITIFTATLVTALLTMPYMLLDFRDFYARFTTESDLAKGIIVYPYTIQFAGTTPWFYQIQQIALYNMGVPLACVCALGLIVGIVRIWRSLTTFWLIPVAWIVVYFGYTGSLYTKYPRYQLPIFPMLILLGCLGLATVLRRGPDLIPAWLGLHNARFVRGIVLSSIGVTLAFSGIFTMAFLNMYSQPVTRYAASDWIYQHVPFGAKITHEVWDDPLPFATRQGDPGMYTYVDLNLYDADTPAKTTTLAQQLASSDVIAISSNRLLGSITKIPATYPMTTRYYQLLFNGQLGFHLAARFANSPNLGPLRFPDNTADESLSVYDHPTVWIFTRSGPSMSSDQIRDLLNQGIAYPTDTPLASKNTLLLTPAMVDANNQTLPLWQTFDPAGLATKLAVPLWWLVIELLGALAFPLVSLAMPALADKGWGLSKTVGIVLLGYFVWLPASISLLPYERGTVWFMFGLLGMCGILLGWSRRTELGAFFREHWRTVVATELLMLGAFLFFVLVRSADPDLWHIWRGGEKPMELTFINGILRSRTFPPADAWFAGGYINYYYYGQYLIATLIQLTGIVPTTAFNLAIPLLFALSIGGAISIVGGITRRWWAGVSAGVLLAFIGNLDGLRQLLLQFQAMMLHQPVPPYDYWASSRVIPYTINEFPFWSYLYADLHAHIIDMMITLVLVGIGTSMLLRAGRERPGEQVAGITLMALTLGTIYCTNTWDFPTYVAFTGFVIIAAQARSLVLARLGGQTWTEVWQGWFRWKTIRVPIAQLVGGIGGAFLLFAPYLQHFQSFVTGIGLVRQGTTPEDFVRVHGLFIFLALSYIALDCYDRWNMAIASRGSTLTEAGKSVRAIMTGIAIYLLYVIAIQQVRIFLALLLLAGITLALTAYTQSEKQLTYLFLLIGFALALAVEIVYIKDDFAGSVWERNNTVFKFYIQVWMFLALGGGLALRQMVERIWQSTAGEVERLPATATPAPSGGLRLWQWHPSPLLLTHSRGDDARPAGGSLLLTLRGIWLAGLILIVGACSIFLYQGTLVRLADRPTWVLVQPPVNPPPALPSLDGFAYMYSWYPEDAHTIDWINEHVGGTPTIVEASGMPYTWDNRLSIYTGLPGLIGWDHHQRQQRYELQVDQRLPIVDMIYTLGDPVAVGNLLHEYHVSYVYVAPLECLQYVIHEQNLLGPDPNHVKLCQDHPEQQGALAVFGQMVQSGQMRVAYQWGAGTLYQVMATGDTMPVASQMVRP